MKSRLTGTVLINRQGKKPKISAGCGVFFLSLLLLNLTTNSEAVIVTIDPGDVGTNTSYIQDFSVLDCLNGTVLNGQTQSVDIFFANNKFLVAAGYNGFTVDLFINQDGPIGAWPTNSFTVTGYLMDAAGNALGSSVSFSDSGSMPAQIWPKWPFYLSDNTEYLPATRMLESKFFGSHIYGNPNGYYINPVTFSGVHFDITYPDSPTNTVMGGRIVISCFDGSIFISPNPAPQYTRYLVYIPKPRLTLTKPGPPGGSNSNIFSLRLAGTRNYPYILLSATNLTYPINWQPFITNSADTNGNWNITITNIGNVPSEYFQAVAWPWIVHQ
jgi:hypothetical protein